jgi:hypothetical protein
MSMTEYDNAEYDDGFPRFSMPAAIAKAAEQVGEAAAAIAKTADAATAILTRVNGWLAKLEEILP